MQVRTPISSMDLKTCIANLRKNPKFTEEMIQLVQEDLSYGLTKEETEEYTERRFDYKQMKIYSQCLRNEYDKEVRDVIATEGLNADQMAIAMEFYSKGVSLDTIKEVVTSEETTAYTMKKLFQDALSKMQSAGQSVDTEIPYAKMLFEQIERVVSKIEYQEQRYDALNEKIQTLQTNQSDVNVHNNLLTELKEKDVTMSKQQDELNEAKATIIRLKSEISEIQKQQEEAKIKENKGRNEAENMTTDKKEQEPSPTAKKPAELPAVYHAAIVDDNGRIVQMVPVEQMKRKNKSTLTALFSRIHFKKRVDIIRMVAERNLSPKQLMQIRIGIERGLNEQQITILIDNDLPPEQMEEIINIAVYENNQMERQGEWK